MFQTIIYTAQIRFHGMGSTSQKKRNLKNKIKRKQTTEFKTGGQAEILVGGVGLKY